MLTLKWGYMPNEVRREVEPIIKQYLWMIPGWCRTLNVSYRKENPDTQDAMATAWASPEYRNGSIQVHALWLDENPTERRDTLIHELAHIVLAPMVSEHEKAIARLFEEDGQTAFRKTLEEQWRMVLEGAVQDTAHAILLIPPVSLPTVEYREEEDEHPKLEAA